MKAKVTIGTIFIDDVKYTRGQIVEVDTINGYGTALEEYVEPAPVKKKVAKKKAAKKVEDAEG